jgi:replicative DNA helicase
MPSLDVSLCVHIVRNDGWFRVLDAGIESQHLFDDGQAMFECVRDHFAQYGKVPDADTVEQDTGLAVPMFSTVTEPLDYYIDRVKDRALDKLATEKVKAAVAALERTDSEGAVEAAKELLTEVSRQNLAGEMIDDWVRGTDERWDDYQRVKSHPGGVTGIPTPWDGVNDITQGLNPGDLWILVARMGSGKTWHLLKMAQTAWLAEANPLFISMEMPRQKIKLRLDALWAKTPYSDLRRGNLGMHIEPVYQQALDGLKDKTPFHLVTRKRIKTPRDVAILVEQLRPGAVFIDGLYKMRPSRGSFRQQWERMSELVDEVQELSQEKEIPFICTTQFNREQTKKGKGGKGGGKGRQDSAGLEDMALSDAIAMNADVVLALLSPDSLRANNEILLKFLKNREDEVKHFTSKFDLSAMEFEQTGEWGDDDDFDDGPPPDPNASASVTY